METKRVVRIMNLCADGSPPAPATASIEARQTIPLSRISEYCCNLYSLTEVNINNTTFTANTGNVGGALSLGSTNFHTRVYDNCIFEDNTATKGGRGVLLQRHRG